MSVDLRKKVMKKEKFIKLTFKKSEKTKEKKEIKIRIFKKKRRFEIKFFI